MSFHTSPGVASTACAKQGAGSLCQRTASGVPGGWLRLCWLRHWFSASLQVLLLRLCGRPGRPRDGGDGPGHESLGVLPLPALLLLRAAAAEAQVARAAEGLVRPGVGKGPPRGRTAPAGPASLLSSANWLQNAHLPWCTTKTGLRSKNGFLLSL